MSGIQGIWVGSLLFLWFMSPVRAETVQVAVSSNFQGAFDALKTDFERETSHQVLATSGATGKFYAQIKAGAPFDILLAADQSTPEKLEAEGAAVTGSRFTYATGRLVLWSKDPKKVDIEGRVLQSDGFAHLAIASPKVAPYGAAAIEVLRRIGLYDRLRPRLVEGESIAQAQQFVASGNAELGFLALSQVCRDGQLTSGSAWFVPDQLHGPIHQQAVLLRHGETNQAAKALLAFLKAPQRLPLLTSFGYVR